MASSPGIDATLVPRIGNLADPVQGLEQSAASQDGGDGRNAAVVGTLGNLKFFPLGNQVIVEQDKIEQIGSIAVSEQAQTRATTGTVIATGPGLWDPHTGRTRPIAVKPGDRVLFGPYDGMKAVVDGDYKNEFMVLSDECCRCILKKVR